MTDSCYFSFCQWLRESRTLLQLPGSPDLMPLMFIAKRIDSESLYQEDVWRGYDLSGNRFVVPCRILDGSTELYNIWDQRGNDTPVRRPSLSPILSQHRQKPFTFPNSSFHLLHSHFHPPAAVSFPEKVKKKKSQRLLVMFDELSQEHLTCYTRALN